MTLGYILRSKVHMYPYYCMYVTTTPEQSDLISFHSSNLSFKTTRYPSRIVIFGICVGVAGKVIFRNISQRHGKRRGDGVPYQAYQNRNLANTNQLSLPNLHTYEINHPKKSVAKLEASTPHYSTSSHPPLGISI